LKAYKIISFSLCLIFVSAALCVPTGAVSDTTVYTAIGDSIAAGYALPSYTDDGCTPAEGYVSAFAKKLGADTVNDLAISGIDTDGVLYLLKNDENYIECIKSADVITVSLGSNDLLTPGIEMIADALLEDPDAPSDKLLDYFESADLDFMISSIKKLAKHVEKPEQQETLRGISEKFKENWTKVIDEIRALNPTAEIIVTDFYNPYQIIDIFAENDIIQPLLDAFNLYINEHEYNGTEYKIAKISEIGKVVGFTNVNPIFGQMDVHPNTRGHDYIARRVWSVYSGEPFEDKTETDTQSVAPETTKAPTNTTVAATSGSSGKGCSGFPAVSVLAMVFIPTAVFIKRKQ